MKSSLIRVISFICIFLLSLVYINKVFELKNYPALSGNLNELVSPYTLREKADGFYEKSPNTLDVLFLGSSNVHCNINPNILWQNYGFTSYDFTADCQDIYSTYYYLEEALKTQSPSVVVIDIYVPTNDGYMVDNSAAHYSLDQLNFSLTKLRYTFRRISKESRMEMLFPLIKYHNRWKELEEHDFKYIYADKHNVFNGYFAYMITTPQDYPEYIECPPQELSDTTCEALEKIIKLCKDKNIDCVFIKTPLVTRDMDNIFNAFKEYVEADGCSCWLFNEYYDQIGIDFQTDYADLCHMNYFGAVKFTNYLGQMLTQEYNLPDHRNDPAYQEWNDDLNEMLKVLDTYINNSVN